MARKKKQTRKKAEPVNEESVFWPLAGAVALIVLGVLLLLGGFGTGGVLPVSMFEGVYWALGWAAYFTPVGLVFLGALKFTSEDRQIPLHKLASMVSFFVLTASWLHVAFASTDEFGEITSGNGGEVGRVIGNLALNALDKFPASLVFFVFSVLAFFLVFGISPRVLLHIGKLFQRREEEGELGDLKARAQQNSFKLNEGVPVEHHQGAGTLKNTAQKLAPAEDHQALTIASDPDWQFPPLSLLNHKQDKADAGNVEGNAEIIKESFANFSIEVEMEGANIGPRVTQYTLKPPTGVKLTKITALENNLSLDLAAHSIRIEAPIPGKRLVGIEVPNVKPAIVRISSLLESDECRAIACA